MDKITQIRSLLKDVTGTASLPDHFHLMEVIAVNGDTCKASLNELILPEIRLSSIIEGSENGILITPSIGSIILVADLSKGDLRDLVAISYSSVDSIRVLNQSLTFFLDASTFLAEIAGNKIKMNKESISLLFGSSSLQLTDNLIRLNEGENSGLVKIEELVARLNTIERDINDLKTLWSSWQAVNAAMEPDATSLHTAVMVWAGSHLQETTKNEIENTKIIH